MAGSVWTCSGYSKTPVAVFGYLIPKVPLIEQELLLLLAKCLPGCSLPVKKKNARAIGGRKNLLENICST